MATVTRTIGPADHGRRMRFADFIDADFEEGWLYELARGKIIVTQVPAPDHGMIVERVEELFVAYKIAHPGIIRYRAGGSECRIRLPGMASDRHPDQAIYLSPRPPGRDAWSRWRPALVVEVISRGSRRRDLVEKRDEYFAAGIDEYWAIDPKHREMKVHSRLGDTWEIRIVAANHTYRCNLLPGLEVRPADLIGPAGDL
jgi:Uma2 family endonuclease